MIPRTRSGCRIRTVAFSSSGTCRQRPRSLPPRSPPSSGETETLQLALSLRPGGTPGPQPRSPSRSAPLRSFRAAQPRGGAGAGAGPERGRGPGGPDGAPGAFGGCWGPRILLRSAPPPQQLRTGVVFPSRRAEKAKDIF